MTPISIDVTDEAALTVLPRRIRSIPSWPPRLSPQVSSAADAAQVRADEAQTPGPDAIRPSHSRGAGE